MKQEDTMSVQKMTKMALCVALCCVAAYISVPLPFTTAMITALTLAMNLTAFILKPRETFAVLCVHWFARLRRRHVGCGQTFRPYGGIHHRFCHCLPNRQLAQGDRKFV